MLGLNIGINNNIKYRKPVFNRFQSFSANNVNSIIQKGDQAYNENRLEDAIKFYTEAQTLNPDEIVLNRKLGKSYYNLKKYEQAEVEYNKYVEKNPNNVDALIEIGQVQRQRGKYLLAMKTFEKAISLDNGNDLAKRSLQETKNDLLGVFYPQQALNEKNIQAQKTLSNALNMAVQYMGNKYMQDLADVQIKFGDTASMGGTSNIAQYENYKKTITVSNSYIYAAPQVIAAYLVHESVHAKDKDAYTSVREEQDAYEIATKFWIKNSNGVNDPEMDYAAELYNQSPDKLKNRVEEIYRLRDPEIASTSPNHPPFKLFNINPTKRKSASQSLKEYGIIA